MPRADSVPSTPPRAAPAARGASKQQHDTQADGLLDRLYKIGDGVGALRSLSSDSSVKGDVLAFIVDGIEHYMNGIFDSVAAVIEEAKRSAGEAR